MDTNKKTIDIIVPCYNEEDVLNLFYTESSKVTEAISDYNCRYIFVDDGSRDKTLSILRELAEKHSNVNYISFSRNFGKEAAMKPIRSWRIKAASACWISAGTTAEH